MKLLSNSNDGLAVKRQIETKSTWAEIGKSTTDCLCMPFILPLREKKKRERKQSTSRWNTT